MNHKEEFRKGTTAKERRLFSVGFTIGLIIGFLIGAIMSIGMNRGLP